MPVPAILIAPIAKLLTGLIGHVDPAVREKAWNLYQDKRHQKLQDATKFLVDHYRNLHEVLNKLVAKPDFKKTLLSLGKDEATKFYSTKGKAKGQAERVFKLL